MQRIAKFHKVSLEQFKKDWIDTFGLEDEADIQEIYDGIKLPRRATAGSAGYDFYAPVRLVRARRSRFLPVSVQRWRTPGFSSVIREAAWVSNIGCS